MAATLITNNGGYVEYAGLHTDSKPTDGIATGSVFIEVDTGKVFFFNSEGSAWIEQFSYM